ncbi:hypothetical protein PXH66_13835 [Synoicihabitans lomoniglobus]|uniref:Uncharacterized protein n=2 Tax=Synoicihabitans lomoniglobus TaxID=2909285 RepID=A0AAE9ZV74_9BACT|nr:hypothetical protein PXH66_13835 [Opitutaceae bacterium LMO-M01]
MESHELLKDLLKQTSAKQVSGDMGLSLSLIYKWAEKPSADAGSGAVNPLDRVKQLMEITGDKRVAQWVAKCAGGFFINNPAALRDSDELIPATNDIVRQFADMLGVIASAASDQEITDAEAKSIRAQWEGLKSVTEGFVQAAEAGNFSKLKDELTHHQDDSAA